jgi:hypothetical protein
LTDWIILSPASRSCTTKDAAAVGVVRHRRLGAIIESENDDDDDDDDNSDSV